jgi:hypothetical protein
LKESQTLTTKFCDLTENTKAIGFRVETIETSMEEAKEPLMIVPFHRYSEIFGENN